MCHLRHVSKYLQGLMKDVQKHGEIDEEDLPDVVCPFPYSSCASGDDNIQVESVRHEKQKQYDEAQKSVKKAPKAGHQTRISFQSLIVSRARTRQRLKKRTSNPISPPTRWLWTSTRPGPTLMTSLRRRLKRRQPRPEPRSRQRPRRSLLRKGGKKSWYI
jgi:hypothetical protein